MKRKRKDQDKDQSQKKTKKGKVSSREFKPQEDIVSESDLSSVEDDRIGPDSSESEEETAQDKRLRLAKQYLAKLEQEEREKLEDEEDARDAIAHRLQEDVLEQAGRLQRPIAHQYETSCENDVRWLRGHSLPVTCVAISPDDKYIFSGSKDCSIIKWSVDGFHKTAVIKSDRHRKGQKEVLGHRHHVLALAISSDGKFLASGGLDNVVMLWNAESCKLLHIFRGHKNAISGLAFRKNSHTLFSCSFDRSVKVWSVDEMAYVETLFGHQDPIIAIDSMVRERALTAGGSDRTIRLWKIPEESHLIFRGHTASIDCCKMINEQHMVAGSQDGSLSLWSINKKKPTAKVMHAHSGSEMSLAETLAEANGMDSRWISAVTAMPCSDLVASGSMDGCVKLWRCADSFSKLEELFSVPVTGVVNALAFSSSGDFLAAAVGRDHRLGRWWTVKEAKNRLAIIHLKKSDKVER